MSNRRLLNGTDADCYGRYGRVGVGNYAGCKERGYVANSGGDSYYGEGSGRATRY